MSQRISGENLKRGSAAAAHANPLQYALPLNTGLHGAIIGCGLIGRKRATAFHGAITVCCDVQEARAGQLAQDFPGVSPVTDWQAAVRRDDIDFVVAATTHDMLAPVAAAAAAAGKHVLIEKPGARRAAELDAVAEAAARTGALVRVGFNHRYHRAFRQAREIFDSGALGEMMFIRGRYGHGGRPGYDKEWRAVPEISGGGELIDQGAHLIDLSRWFLGDVTLVAGRAPTYFWNMPVEDNGFLLLETPRGQVAFLHASWTEWKNLFSFEIAGRVGKLEVGGLGGSYGLERLTWYRMSPAMGPPETMAWEYPMADDSWDAECAAFLEDIRLGRPPQPGVADAQAALRVIEQVYSREKPA
jgi:predicted dehydrogenase